MTSMRTSVHDADALPRFPKLTYIISAEITRGVRRDAKNAVRFTICLDKPACLGYTDYRLFRIPYRRFRLSDGETVFFFAKPAAGQALDIFTAEADFCLRRLFMNFGLTLTEVLLMFAYAVPGYLLVKSRLVGEKAIPGFAALLMYVLQPCLCIDSFRQITYTPEAFSRMAWFFIICLVLQALSAAAIYAVSRLVMGERFAADTSSRIAVIAGVAGNVGFMGVPLLRALLPDYPEASALSAMFFLAMGLLCWTVGSACITGDVRHMSFKRAFLNPPVIALAVALPLFFTNTRLPASIADPIGLLADMTTPVCMLILGMRFATFPIREIFSERVIYPTALVKLILFPLASYAVVRFLPFPAEMKAALVIMAACPTANVVLSLSEPYGAGQKTSSLIVLSSTVFCIFTIPLVLLVL